VGASIMCGEIGDGGSIDQQRPGRAGVGDLLQIIHVACRNAPSSAGSTAAESFRNASSEFQRGSSTASD